MTGEKTGTVVIIGAGIVGASVAYHLASRGCTNIWILEKAAVEVSGSTARSAAGVRHQFASEVNIRLSLYSIERIKRFSEEVGGSADLRQVGYLLLVDDVETWKHYQRSADLQRSLGVRVDTLSPADAARIVPQIWIEDLVGATFCADDGYCDPYGIAMGYLARARELGVRLARATPAIGFEKIGDRLLGVRTPAGVIHCDWIVNAAGPWAGEVGAMAGLEIPVNPYRRCIYLTEPFPGIPSDIPLTIDVGTGFYMRKEKQKVLFGASNESEPPGENLAVDWDWMEKVLEMGVRRFPVLAEAGLAYRNCWAGLYEITPDHQPILGRHPELSNYVDASGFSGHGIQHAPATGMLIAEEILDGRAQTIDIDPLRINRFRENRPPIESNIY
jgi:sarcosine oxidase, subunit beta